MKKKNRTYKHSESVKTGRGLIKNASYDKCA